MCIIVHNLYIIYTCRYVITIKQTKCHNSNSLYNTNYAMLSVMHFLGNMAGKDISCYANEYSYDMYIKHSFFFEWWHRKHEKDNAYTYLYGRLICGEIKKRGLLYTSNSTDELERSYLPWKNESFLVATYKLHACWLSLFVKILIELLNIDLN